MNRAQVNRMAFLFMMTYMVSYMTRINYGAIISEMEQATQISRPLLSLAVTGSFITYGAGQIISGLCGDRFQPKTLVFLGLLTTVLMNALIPFCNDPMLMLAVWCINGFAQAFMWPPIVRLMTALFSDEDYKRVSVVVAFGGSFGTIAVYLISPLLISLFDWRGVFWFSALSGALMAAFWWKFAGWLPNERPAKKAVSSVADDSAKAGRLLTPMLLIIMLSIACQGALRDGVTTWMPSYISETYQLGNSIAILTGVIMPVFSLISLQGSAVLYRKLFKNPMTCILAFFVGGAISAGALALLGDASVISSILFSALLTGCMHGANLIMTCMLPPFFKSRGNVSTVSGLLNSCTYVGSAVSTYGIALVSQYAGWHTTILLWLGIALLGALLCGVCIPRWRSKFMQ